MKKYQIVTPVTAWMKGGIVESETADDAIELAYGDMTPYPKLCDCCAKNFSFESPDETGVSVREIKN